MRNLVLAMENKENARFPSVSDGAIDKLSSKYVSENMEKMTRWAVTVFYDWRDAHNAQLTNRAYGV